MGNICIALLASRKTRKILDIKGRKAQQRNHKLALQPYHTIIFANSMILP